MSQIEQNMREFFAKKPEIERCSNLGLINRRALTRYLIKEGIAHSHQSEAIVATLRRFKFRTFENEKTGIFKQCNIRLKDGVAILDFEKNKELMIELKKTIDSTNYDSGETLKIVIGSASIKVFLDDWNTKTIDYLENKFKLKNKLTNISEISMMFPEASSDTKGIISTLARTLYIHDILITELLTDSPELLLYLKEIYAVQTYKILKELTP